MNNPASSNYTKGSIRVILGLILIMGGVGAIEQSANISVISLIICAIGIYSMYSGANAFNSSK